MIDPKAAHKALLARDVRFDGVFFVGVTSTGIYCRPVCPVKSPRAGNCRFFESAAAAEKAGFRPCLRCRPELAPGSAPMDSSRRIAYQLVEQLEEGLSGDGVDLETIAARVGLSSRQVRRITVKELGVTPIDLIQTRRLLLAKQLLTETRLPVIDVAFASGFASLRRFNDAFSRQYRMPPTRLRRAAGAAGGGTVETDATTALKLSYRPPYDWTAMLEFFRARQIDGVESVTPEAYSRSLRLGDKAGWLRVTHLPDERSVRLEVPHVLTGTLQALLGLVRRAFDLSAQPDLIARHLRKDRRLRASLARSPGLRTPGAFDAFELTWRAILGQQITVKAATTLAGRFARAFGEPLRHPVGELTHLTPHAERIAVARVTDIVRLGITSPRATAIRSIARALHSGSLRLESGGDPEAVMAQLMTLPGIGPWTAQYIAMRALRWPDAFPSGDVAVLKSLGGLRSREAEALSQAWSPWRSYAVMHLWRSGRP